MTENIKKILPLFVVVAAKSIYKAMPLECQIPNGSSIPLPW
jgi:hypothetical protein